MRRVLAALSAMAALAWTPRVCACVRSKKHGFAPSYQRMKIIEEKLAKMYIYVTVSIIITINSIM